MACIDYRKALFARSVRVFKLKFAHTVRVFKHFLFSMLRMLVGGVGVLLIPFIGNRQKDVDSGWS